MKAELSFTPQVPGRVILKLAILGGILLASVFGVLELLSTGIKLLQ